MDFASVVLFLIMYYLRPQEWYGFLSNLRPVQLTMILALVGLLTREGSIKLKDLFRTPHDWIMSGYFLWTILGSPTPWGTFTSIQSQILTYFVAVQALTNLDRMRKLLGWWALMMLTIAALAIASAYGFDPLGGYDRVLGQMKGRLILNLSIFNNPNALAHSVVPVIPLLYFLLFWKRVVTKAWVVLMVIPLWCIYLTLSKGAFLCGFVTILVTLTFGRPKTVQVLIFVLAVGFGYGALYTLPRMNELDKKGTDPAIRGRIAAYTFGYQCMQESFTGIGLSNFTSEFFRRGPLEYPEHPKRVLVTQGDRMFVKTLPMVGRHYTKAPHGSYNQNGAELGYVGLALFVGIMYCCGRTLVTAQNVTVEEDRVRRSLFVILIAYAVSSWMVDFCYRTTFFLLAAATGAFHRHLMGYLDRKPGSEEQSEAAPMSPFPGPMAPLPPAPALVPLAPLAPMPGVPVLASVEAPPSEPAEPISRGFIRWKRIGLVDLGMIAFLTWGVVKYWAYLIHNF